MNNGALTYASCHLSRYPRKPAAFEAALKHAAQHSADQLIIAGNIVNGAPDSKDCLDLARSLGCPILRCNHEGLRHAQRLPALGD